MIKWNELLQEHFKADLKHLAVSQHLWTLHNVTRN